MAKPLVDDALWERIEPLLPVVARRYRYPGRKRMPDRQAVTGILFVLKTGIAWEDLPAEMGCGSGMTCWRRLRDWNDAGVWTRLHQVLLDELHEVFHAHPGARRAVAGPGPSSRRGAGAAARAGPPHATAAACGTTATTSGDLGWGLIRTNTDVGRPPTSSSSPDQAASMRRWQTTAQPSSRTRGAAGRRVRSGCAAAAGCAGARRSVRRPSARGPARSRGRFRGGRSRASRRAYAARAGTQADRLNKSLRPTRQGASHSICNRVVYEGCSNGRR
jgi:transposase